MLYMEEDLAEALQLMPTMAPDLLAQQPLLLIMAKELPETHQVVTLETTLTFKENTEAVLVLQ
jgi:hypothetical protein